MNKLTVSDIDFRGLKALVRVDFNVPLDDDGRITDDRRIRGALDTIRKIISDGGMIIACSHLGRPKGKVNPAMSLRPVAKRLAELLERRVTFVEDCVGQKATAAVSAMKPGDVLLLENLRFHAEETANDPAFARQLADLADVYVNDAFGSAHRAHASTEGVTKFFEQSAAGFLMEKELQYLGRALADPKRPFVAILGGAKISGKIDVIKNLIGKVDRLLIGGGMVYTFAKAMGYSIGNSLLEEDKVELARTLIADSKGSRTDLLFPTDAVVASEISDDAVTKVVSLDKIPDGMMGLDIGPATIKLFSAALADAKTVVWNGPMGVFEHKPFASGTLGVARELALITANGAVTVVGGGDSAAAVTEMGLDDELSHISTGGGASLEFLEGKQLPGVAALTDAVRTEKV